MPQYYRCYAANRDGIECNVCVREKKRRREEEKRRDREMQTDMYVEIEREPTLRQNDERGFESRREKE